MNLFHRHTLGPIVNISVMHRYTFDTDNDPYYEVERPFPIEFNNKNGSYLRSYKITSTIHRFCSGCGKTLVEVRSGDWSHLMPQEKVYE